MLGVLLISHGRFAESLVENVSHIMGGLPSALVALGVFPEDDLDNLYTHAQGLVAALDQGEGVLVMTDIFGASPANLAKRLLVPGRVEGLAGLNLPMLVRALAYREQGLAMLLEKAKQGGIAGVVDMKQCV